MGLGLSSGGASIPTVGPSKFSLMQSRMIFGRNNFSLTTNTTLHNTYTAEADFDWVQLGYFNFTLSSVAIDRAAIAPSASLNDNFTPVTGTWTNVTFNNSGAAGVPPSPSGSTTSFTIPAGSGSGNDIIPGIAWSDWMQVSSLARTDSPTVNLPLLMVRTYSNATQLPTFAPATQADISTDWPTISLGRTFYSYYKTGDFVTTPSGFTSPNGPHKFIAPNIVRFISRKRGLTVLGIGDSLTQGVNSTSGFNSWGHQACAALSSSSLPIMWMNGGWTGQTSSAYYTRARALIRDGSPDVCFIATWTPNDSPFTQASADLSWARAIDLANYCISLNIVPVLWTPIPQGGTTSTTDAYRLSVVARVKASGFLYADFDAVLTDGATPARIKAAANSIDGVHPGDAGYGFMAAEAQRCISAIMSNKPRTG